MTAPQVFAVSEPPAPVLSSDPPAGLIFGLPHDLSSATPMFDNLEHLRFDAAGNGYVTFHDGSDVPGTGGVLFIEDVVAREGVTFNAARDYLLTGAEVSLAGPRDLVVAEDLGILVVADFAYADIKVIDLHAESNTPLLFVTSNLGMTAAGEPRKA